LGNECVVIAGYPEMAQSTEEGWSFSPEYYNSTVVVGKDGDTIANYRKSFLYFSDKQRALDEPDRFYDGQIPGLGNVAMGICKWETGSYEGEPLYSTLERYVFNIINLFE
jgi:protein N-terminal amidase